MLHNLKPDELGPMGPEMADAISACVHCGYCLPSCPTYQLLGQEQDSPRGRIFLMKEVLEGELEPSEIAESIDQCLGCSACVTSCPSGVEYGHLLNGYKHLKHRRRGKFLQRLRDSLVQSTFAYPNRFRWAIRFGRLFKPFSRLLPATLRPMLELLPDRLPHPVVWPNQIAAEGKVRAKVVLLTGCAQDVLAPRITKAAISVLVRNGVEVIIPEGQGCCGALAWHAGQVDTAAKMAGNLSRKLPLDVDAVLTTAAGCGSALKEYGLITLGTPDHQVAETLAGKTKDICEFLDELGMVPSSGLPRLMRVAYHDACHLLHAQGIDSAPRRLLKSVANLELLELPNPGRCCGSAGSYNIEQPGLAEPLGRDKAREILSTEVHAVATGNIGCMVQLERHLTDSSNNAPPVWHTIEVLERAFRPRSLTEMDQDYLRTEPSYRGQ